MDFSVGEALFGFVLFLVIPLGILIWYSNAAEKAGSPYHVYWGIFALIFYIVAFHLLMRIIMPEFYIAAANGRVTGTVLFLTFLPFMIPWVALLIIRLLFLKRK